MRFLLPPVAAALAAAALAAQQDQPTPQEATALATAKAHKGLGGIDPALAPAARVWVKFPAAADATLVALAKHPQVGAIQVTDGTACTTRGFAALKGLPHLRKLVLNKSGVSDQELAEVVKCGQLRVLVIPEASVTDAGLAGLAGLPRLESLDLSDNPRLTDKAAAHIKGLPRLENLFLNKTGLTDKGLAELRPLEALRDLTVAGTKVTAKAAEAFAEDMPNLRAVRR
jgi:Leucine-rich repeat (LRR) protein